jgi:hypothetical protein
MLTDKQAILTVGALFLILIVTVIVVLSNT